MKGLRVLSAILLASFLALTVRSQQTIEFLSVNTDPPGQGIRYMTSMTTVPAIAKRTNKICFNGMWAMYNTTSYGNANPSATTVYPALGYSLQSCSTSVGSIASKINSFRQLAAPALPALPVPGVGIEFWNMPYFLGPSEPAVMPAVPAMVKSFAINNSLMPKAYVICNKAGICACCDTFNGHYLVPDIAAWPTKENPLGDMATFMEVPTSADPMCTMAMYQPLK